MKQSTTPPFVTNGTSINTALVSDKPTRSYVRRKKSTLVEGTTTISVAVLNVTKCLIGGAMLSFPWAFSKSTFIPGLIGCALATWYSYVTTMFVIHACETTLIFEFSALLKYVHPHLEIAAGLTVIFCTFNACLIYIMLVGDFFTEGMHGLNEDWAFPHDDKVYKMAFFFVILLPLSLLKEFRLLKYSSFVGNAANLYCVVLALIYTIYYYESGERSPPEGFKWNEWNEGVLIVTNICAKAFAAQYAVPPMYEQLKDRSPERMRLVLLLGFGATSVIYLSFTFCGYVLYGEDTEGDVLLNYPEDNVFFIVARFAMTLNIIGCYPLLFKCLAVCVEQQFFNRKKGCKLNFKEYPKMRTFVIVMLGLVILSVAMVVDDVGPVSSIEGAVIMFLTMAIFPVLIAWKVGNPNFTTGSVMVNSYLHLSNQASDPIESSRKDSDSQATQKAEDRVRSQSSIYLVIILLIGCGMGCGGLVLQFLML